jgi:RHS repeat-associated protein
MQSLKQLLNNCAVSLCVVFTSIASPFLFASSAHAQTNPDPGFNTAYAQSCPQYQNASSGTLATSCITALSGFWTDNIAGHPTFTSFDNYAQWALTQAQVSNPNLQIVYQNAAQTADNNVYTPTSDNIIYPISTNVIAYDPTTTPPSAPETIGSANFYGNCGGNATFAYRMTNTGDAYPNMSEAFCTYTAPARNSCPDGTCGLNSVDVPNSTQYSSTPSFTVPGSSGMVISQYYNSSNGQWSLSMDKSISFSTINGNRFAVVQNAMGNRDNYSYNAASNTWTSTSLAVTAQLSNVYDTNNNLTGYKIVTAGNVIENYDINGFITNSQPLGKGATVMVRDGLERIHTITTPDNQTITVNYKYSNNNPTNQNDFNANSIISSINLPNSQSIQYTENTSHQMTSVTLPDGTGAQFTYNGSGNRLDSILDLNNNVLQSTTYNSSGAVSATSNNNGNNGMNYTLNSGQTVGTDALNNQTTYNYSNIAGNNQVSSLSALCTTCSGLQGTTVQYDSAGNPLVMTDYLGNSTHIAWNTVRKLPTTIIEAYGTTIARTTSYSWDSTYNLPTEVTEPVQGGQRITIIGYDTNGNIQSKAVTAPLNDGSGNTTTRTEQYQYNSLGQILSYTDAMNHQTTYQYDSSNHLTSMTNSLSQVTQYSNYNSLNLPQTVTLPTGLVATLTYNNNGKILTSTLNNTQTTTYTYDSNGYPAQVTFPDGSYVISSNDPNGVVQKVQHYGEDNALLGEFDYTYDKMNNLTQVSKKIPSGESVYSQTHKYNQYNLLSQDINNFNTPYQYSYDSNGNLSQTVDQVNNTIVKHYDALNRLIQVNYPDSSVVKYGYDNGSRINSVTDGKNIVTNYTYDGFDEIIKVVSADAGTTQYTYNAVGKVVTKTDARGIVSTYSYDNLNRLTGVSYNTTPSPTTVAMTYDTCQVGKLCSITDKTGGTSYNYDIYGNILNKVQTVTIGSNSKTFTTQYGYNSSNQLNSITLPSGDIESMSYYGHRVQNINVTIGTGSVQALLSNIQYYPMGPVFSFNYGTSSSTATHERDMDTNYFWSAISDSTAPAITRTYNPNNDGTIDTILDNSPAKDSYGYNYDSMQRITEFDSLSGAVENYTYDKNSNRSTKVYDTASTNKTTTYHFKTNTNQLSSLSGHETQSFTYDAMGNMLTDGTYTYTYDEAGRMLTATSSTNSISYQINYLGLRVSKTVNGTTTYFIYDENNQLIGEYDSNSNPVKEHIYLAGMPVGLISNSNLYYVHPDHLGSPRTITDTSNNVVWTWANDNPFGTNLPVENGISDYNLRFLGQYFDNDTKLNYNFHRDYNPNTGRYVQADPIGLNGGLNLYGYAGGNPTGNFDDLGLETTIYIVNSSTKLYGHVALGFNGYIYDLNPLNGTTFLGFFIPGGNDNSELLPQAGEAYGLQPTENQFILGSLYDNKEDQVEAFTLNLSEEQEAQLAFQLLKINSLKYQALSYGGLNCVSFVNYELKNIGLTINPEGNVPSFESNALEDLYDDGNPLINNYSIYTKNIASGKNGVNVQNIPRDPNHVILNPIN